MIWKKFQWTDERKNLEKFLANEVRQIEPIIWGISIFFTIISLLYTNLLPPENANVLLANILGTSLLIGTTLFRLLAVNHPRFNRFWVGIRAVWITLMILVSVYALGGLSSPIAYSAIIAIVSVIPMLTVEFVIPLGIISSIGFFLIGWRIDGVNLWSPDKVFHNAFQIISPFIFAFPVLEYTRETMDKHKQIFSLDKLRNQFDNEQKLLKKTLKGIGEGLILTDKQGNILLANRKAKKLLDIPQNTEIRKQNVNTLSKWVDENGWPINIETISQSETRISLGVHNAEIKEKFFDFSVRQVSWKNQSLLFGRLIDKTSEYELEKAKMNFVSLGYQDLRTPLLSIQNKIDQLNSQIDSSNSENQDYLLRLRTSVNQLKDLISNLRLVYLLENDGFGLKREPIDWKTLFEKLQQNLQGIARQEVHLTWINELDTIKYQGDPNLLSEGFGNLIRNALENTTKGEIKISGKYEPSQQNIILEVQDTGQGIPDNAQDLLFTKFSKAKTSLDTGQAGLGLGLYVSRLISILHHGRTALESKEDQGTTVRMILPIYYNNAF